MPWKESALKNNNINNIAILEETIRQDWVSYSGVLIYANDIMSKVPLCRVGNDIVSQYKMEEIDCSEVCAIKTYDEGKLLRISSILKRIKDKKGYDIRAEDIPLNDKATIDLICSGDYVWLNNSLTTYMQQLNCVGFNELVDLWSIVGRPQWESIVAKYIAEKNNPQKIYPSPAVEAIFKPTGGILFYKEQLFSLLIDVLGYTSKKALELYDDMIDSIDDLQFQQQEFVRNGLEKGFSAGCMDEFWDMLRCWKNLAVKSVYVGDCLPEYRLAYFNAIFFEFFVEN